MLSGVFNAFSSGSIKARLRAVRAIAVAIPRVRAWATDFFRRSNSFAPKKRAVTRAKPFVRPFRKPIMTVFTDEVAPRAAMAFCLGSDPQYGCRQDYKKAEKCCQAEGAGKTSISAL